jgi:hypothetical protein
VSNLSVSDEHLSILRGVTQLFPRTYARDVGRTAHIIDIQTEGDPRRPSR